MAQRGIATIAINVVGHGFGPLGTLTVNRAAGAPGRAVRRRTWDRPGRKRRIDSTEGVNAAAPQTLVGSRDGLRQTVIDLMQLVREIEVGMDVDGNGTRDLDRGADLVLRPVVRRHLRHEVPRRRAERPPGRPERSGRRDHRDRPAEPGLPPLVWLSLVDRTPPLSEPAGRSQFNENMPLRNLPPLVDTVPGASAIQQLIEWTEWTSQAGNPVAYAPHLRADPLDGVPAKSIILQFARGDQTVPNPTTSAIIRAGGLAGPDDALPERPRVRRRSRRSRRTRTRS